ncbi:hypothetical protein KR018_008866, partial [Drosophila ironensis]
QAQNTIYKASPAPHLMQKTSFSCAGRPAGYYADVETGCQVYHMCDGLGRQFSYTCPNTTLFQQRMLICDHWYMVNCSKAESNYAANLLIGQRDKPFVNDEENNLRTPRPDLLDRPYAPDYSGESFRSQYKQLPPSQNQILDESIKLSIPGKIDLQSTQTRWRLPAPSRMILPPAYEPQIELPSSTVRPRITTTPRRQISTSFATSTTRRPSVSTKRTAVVHSPPPSTQALEQADTEDLGTSHSTRYNTSADYNSAEAPIKQTSSKLVKIVKPPSKIYEPPYIYPIYNLEEPQPSGVLSSTAAPFSPGPRRLEVTTTTARLLNKPTTLAGMPFSFAPPSTTASTLGAPPRYDNRTPAPAQSFRLGTQTNTTARPVSQAQQPFNNLLPPFVDFVAHDIATTQGPPIYYEWKVPSNGLEPPKLDPPIGVDGREFPESVGNYGSEATSKSEVFNTRLNDIDGNLGQSKAPVPQSSTSPRLPISRSIKAKQEERPQQLAAGRRSDAVGSSTDISHLRKQLLIPEYSFPLETIGRTGYGPGSAGALVAGAGSTGDLYNSFQLKIPAQRSKWFGENAKCPECHPSFVLPGTCEPCLRR